MIKQQDVIEQFAYSFARLNVNYDNVSIPSIKKKKGYKYLSAVEKEKFDEIYNTREIIAKRLNRPPHNVFGNEQIFGIARRKVEVEKVGYGRGLSSSVKEEIQERLAKILE